MYRLFMRHSLMCVYVYTMFVPGSTAVSTTQLHPLWGGSLPNWTALVMLPYYTYDCICTSRQRDNCVNSVYRYLIQCLLVPQSVVKWGLIGLLKSEKLNVSTTFSTQWGHVHMCIHTLCMSSCIIHVCTCTHIQPVCMYILLFCVLTL